MTLDEPAAARGFQYKYGDRPLDGYTIQRAAGRGGFGEVYYAVSDSGREVALKLVHTYEQIELRGISQCMNLKSPHLVTIFDVKYGEDGRPWVIMEYVAGPSLRELLDESPPGLGVAKAAFFLREIGKGLSYLHDCGIVHRDLKPENIFYENGLVKIGDYGLSKTMSLSRHSGQTVAVGTLHYMAPEIGDGRYDRSIDIYAMGAMLFEMLTGQVPFYGSSPAEVLMKHLNSNVNLDNVDEPLKSVIRKAMAKNPADRYQSVQEMVEAVFGSEQVRSSVSQFSPASLSMAAGRAARNIGGGSAPGAGARRPATPNNSRDPWTAGVDRFEHAIHNAARKVQEAGDRFAARMSGRRWHYPGWSWPDPGNAEMPTGLRDRDAIALPARIFLMLCAATAAAFLVGVNSDIHTSERTTYTLLSIIGAVIGSRLAWQFIAPGLAGESHWFKRLALGAPAAFMALFFSVPVWVNARRWREGKSVMLATFIGLALLDWEARLGPNRKSRFSLGHAITAAILGLVLAGMWDGDELTIAATLAGASLAASLCAARRLMTVPTSSNPDAAMNDVRRAPMGDAPSAGAAVPPPIAPADYFPPSPSRAAAIPAGAPMLAHEPPRNRAFVIVALALCVPLIVFVGLLKAVLVPMIVPFVIVAMILHYKRGGRMSSTYAPAGAFASRGSLFGGSDLSSEIGGFFSGVARGVLALVGGLLLLLSLLMALAAATNLPGLFTSGVLSPQMPHDLEYALGPNADRVLREIGSFAAFVFASISIALLVIARRRGGGMHMIRAIVGAIILFAAVATLARAMPDWADFVVLKTPGVTIDWYLSHVEMHRAVEAAVIGAIGWTVLCWPKKHRSMFNPAMSSFAPSAPSPAVPATPDSAGANPG
jgi:hypothetical protein